MKRNITMMIVVIASIYRVLTASYKLFQAHYNSSSQQTPWDFINDINLSKDSNLHSLAPEHMKLNILHFFLKRLGIVKSSIILISLAAKGPIAALVSGLLAYYSSVTTPKFLKITRFGFWYLKAS